MCCVDEEQRHFAIFRARDDFAFFLFWLTREISRFGECAVRSFCFEFYVLHRAVKTIYLDLDELLTIAIANIYYG